MPPDTHLPLLQYLAAHQLTVRDMILLIALPATQAELGHTLGISSAAISQRVLKLKKDGLLTATTNERCARHIDVRITDKGWGMVMQISGDLEAMGPLKERAEQGTGALVVS